MTKDEIKNRISMALKDPVLQQGFEIICKENKELEEKISFLLSCKNCPENKGGWVCAKEYEDKCLAQKIQYVKELKKENAELKKKLTKAKEIIKKFSEFVNDEVELDPEHPQEYTDLWVELCEKAEQFLNSEGENEK